MKKILGLDLGTNSIGWALIEQDFDNKKGSIIGTGSRIIPMSQDILGKFDSGQSISQTAERTQYRGVRRLYQRNRLRRDRLHRVLNILGFLPEHYKDKIDFEKHYGQFKEEVKLNYRLNEKGNYEFIFDNSFQEMVNEFNSHGYNGNIPKDWTIYYLREKALHKKIGKEELAWVILNFNQKRGYYQLRGDELIEKDNKNETYHSLKIKAVNSTGESNNRGMWYDVVLENDWIYRRQSDVPLNNWVGMTKEFIVTEKVNKDGSVKRSFRAPKEDDWGLMKKRSEQHIESSNLHVGEYIYQTLLSNPHQKIRGDLIKTIERKYYYRELKAILDHQRKYHPELQDNSLYENCIHDLYKKNISHRNNIKEKGFTYLIVDDVIFYQRPLKSKKSNIGGCQYEYRTIYKKVNDLVSGEYKWQKEKISVSAIHRSHPLFQEYRLWQFISYLKIYQILDDDGNYSDHDITGKLLPTETEIERLFDFLYEQKEIDQTKILKYFTDKGILPKLTRNQKKYRWNYVEDKKYPANETYYLIKKSFTKVKDLNATEFLSPTRLDHLWQILYSVKEPDQYEKALQKYAIKNNLDEISFIDAFKKFPPFKNEYASLSKKAIKKLLPLMRVGAHWSVDEFEPEVVHRIERITTGEYDENIPDRVREKAININSIDQCRGLPVWLAAYIVYGRHSESGIIENWNSPDDMDEWLKRFRQHSLRNPIVEQVVLETIRVVRDIWDQYGNGEKGFYDEIHVELGREMKNSAETRKRISEGINKNQNTNERVRELLTELMNGGVSEAKPHSPSQREILKIYEEGVYENSPEIYNNIKLDEIEKIRRNSNPTMTDIRKYRLWLEQGYISPYTGKIIPLSDLFTTKYQIEHIIPQSRFFDDSMLNKVICESTVNELKGNKTAMEFIIDHGGEKVNLGHGLSVEIFRQDEYESHCNTYFKSIKTKLKNLLSEDIPENFINRQLNDSRYISKLVKTLLSNIVRENNEQEAIAKKMVPVTGAITAKLRHDWGLEDKWNEIIASRFQRLNELTNTKDFGYWDEDKTADGRHSGKKFFRITVPDNIKKGFSKKRIDHRHHALDAIVIACTTKDHINYITSLNSERKNYSLVKKLRHQKKAIINGQNTNVASGFKLPWPTFPNEVKDSIEGIIVSFKQNNRVINKSNNRFWKYIEEDGQWEKKLVKQIKGDNWAIRKSLHKETVSGKINMKTPKGKIATAGRTDLGGIKNQKHIDKITDVSIQKILNNHIKGYLDENGKPRFDLAFSPEGIAEMNNNIQSLNGGKPHQPIYKVRQYEVGVKFPLGTEGNNPDKYVETAKGTNLFFAIYYDERKEKRVYETIPLNEVITHQKQVAHLPISERLPIQPDPSKGKYSFKLSPNELVYVPTNEELENPSSVSIMNLNLENQVYKFVSCTGSQAFFIKSNVSHVIKNKFEFSSLNKMEKSVEGHMIKERCWKLHVNRIGIITSIDKGEMN